MQPNLREELQKKLDSTNDQIKKVMNYFPPENYQGEESYLRGYASGLKFALDLLPPKIIVVTTPDKLVNAAVELDKERRNENS